jgi:transposase InsO family protein
VRYAFIEEQRREYPVTMLCRVLGVTTQGYYTWLKEPVSTRNKEDAELSAKIRVIYADSKGRYGSPRIHDELVTEGKRCGKKRVARLMQAEGLKAKASRKFRVTTDSSHSKPIAPDLVQRNFTAAAPNKVWVGDITYLPTVEGWLYLAVFIDLYSRMVVGWAIGTRMQASLVTLAFARAVTRRRPEAGLIVHTDQGSQYASDAFRQVIADANARQSMGSRGDCYDNAVAESFFHSFKVEAIYGSDIETRWEMEYEVFYYIERFYNRKRKHSALGLRSPEQFEYGRLNNKKAAA